MIRFLVFGFAVAAMPGTASVAQAPDGASYRAHLAAAEASMRLSEPAEARRWLDGAPVAARGWEWRHLDELLDQSMVVVPDLESVVMSLDLSPDGTLIAAALAGGEIVLLERETGVVRTRLAGHAGGTFCARFNTDGTRLASGGSDRVARVWDIRNGAPPVEFKEHKFPVTAVAWTADGSRIFSSAYYVDQTTPIEGRVHLWASATGELLRTYRGGVKPLSSLALAPDESRIAAGSWDSCVFVWAVDGPEGEAPVQLGGKPGPLQVVRINAVTISPDGALLAAGSGDEWTKVYRLDDATEVATITDVGANFGAAAFSPDGATLALGGDNGAVTLWRTSDWTRRATLAGHTQSVRALRWNDQGTALYSGGVDRSVRAWDPAFNAYGGVRGRYGGNNYSVAFSRDGALLACSSSDGSIGAVDSRTGAESLRFKTNHQKEVCTSAISPDGRSIASCSWDQTLRVHDLATKNEIVKVDLPAGAAYLAWSPDGTRIALALRDRTAVVVKVDDWSIERTLTGHGGAVNTVAWNADGTRLLTGGADAAARVWSAADGECVAIMKSGRESPAGHMGSIESAVFVPGTEWVATASHDGSARLWDARSGEHVRLLMTSSDALYRIAASPDGERLAAGGKFLYLLDPASNDALVRERPLRDTIWHLDWSPDGSRLAIGSWNGEIVVFGAPERRRSGH